MTFTRVDHQFSLYDYNDMRPKLVIPMKRITRARYDQALAELRGGKDKKLRNILSDINDALENFDKRLTNRKNGIQKR